jgi:flagellar P-ring protein precursor FlgI
MLKFVKSKILLILIITTFVNAQRIKDIAYFKGTKNEQIIGYGLVVGLAGTGDSYRSQFTIQSVTSMLKRFGITVPQADLRTRNVAAVMVTANVNNFLKEGGQFDVTVSAMGDALSLQGGILLMTPLTGKDGVVYGMAQGPISTGGYDFQTPTGSRAAKNHSATGRVPNGGIVQNVIPNTTMEAAGELSLYLKTPDFSNANAIAEAINNTIGQNTAKPIDATEVLITVPENQQENMATFMARIESISITNYDMQAKVVINERTGTVVSGGNVIINPVTIMHGNLNIRISSETSVVQPNPVTQGQTVVTNTQTPIVNQESNGAIAIQRSATVQEVATALNSLRVSPRDVIAIFQALKEAGALVAELVII